MIVCKNDRLTFDPFSSTVVRSGIGKFGQNISLLKNSMYTI